MFEASSVGWFIATIFYLIIIVLLCAIVILRAETRKNRKPS